VVGFWLAAVSKWEMLIALKFWPGCAFFFSHHETLLHIFTTFDGSSGTEAIFFYHRL
jgi:hypothetical protein